MTKSHEQHFSRTRLDHRNEIAEDYVELIDSLVAEHGEARAVQLARRLGVSRVTVSKTIKRLVRDGLVLADRYGPISLSPAGLQMAGQSRVRHRLVVEFLIRLGVSVETAESDAEGIEHHISEETLTAIRAFLSQAHQQ